MKLTKITNAILAGTLSTFALTASLSAQADDDHFTGQHKEYKQDSDKVVGVYMGNWAGSKGYQVSDIPGNNITHILYAFLRICGPGQNSKDNTICKDKTDFHLAEDANSIDKKFNSDFVKFKQKYPHVKVLPSVGGWGGSNPFFYFANDDKKRAVFVKAMKDYVRANEGFDGVDIDWEHPTNNFSQEGVQLGKPADAQGYADLMRDLRHAMDELEIETGRELEVSSAINTGAQFTDVIKYSEAEPYVDHFFGMTYDFFGSWSSDVGHHTALYPASYSNFGVKTGIDNMLDAGIPASKIVLGAGMYARGWSNVTGISNDNPMTGSGNGKGIGDGEGAYQYRDLVGSHIDSDGKGVNGWEVVYDSTLSAYYLWHETSKTYIGYDDPRAVEEKAEYAKTNGLAGIFSWELTQDNGDILNAMNSGVGNSLANATDSDSDTDTATATETNTATETATETDTDTDTTTECQSDYPSYPNFPRKGWDGRPSHALKGDHLIHNGAIWQANWWTNSAPSATDASWKKISATSCGTDTETQPETPEVTETNTATETDTDTSCSSVTYQAGTKYKHNQLVQFRGQEFQCKVQGWCASPAAWAYAPGMGTYWQMAWNLERTCQ